MTKDELSIIYNVMRNISKEVRKKEDYQHILHDDVDEVLALKMQFQEIREKCSGLMKEYDKPTFMRAEYNNESRMIRLYMHYSNFDVMRNCFLNLPEWITHDDWPIVTAYEWNVYLSNVQQVANILKSLPK